MSETIPPQLPMNNDDSSELLRFPGFADIRDGLTKPGAQRDPALIAGARKFYVDVGGGARRFRLKHTACQIFAEFLRNSCVRSTSGYQR
jgi:hypothetical protein